MDGWDDLEGSPWCVVLVLVLVLAVWCGVVEYLMESLLVCLDVLCMLCMLCLLYILYILCMLCLPCLPCLPCIVEIYIVDNLPQRQQGYLLATETSTHQSRPEQSMGYSRQGLHCGEAVDGAHLDARRMDLEETRARIEGGDQELRRVRFLLGNLGLDGVGWLWVLVLVLRSLNGRDVSCLLFLGGWVIASREGFH